VKRTPSAFATPSRVESRGSPVNPWSPAQALADEAGLLGDPGHAPSTGHGMQGPAYVDGIPLFEGQRQEISLGLGSIEKLGDVEGHGREGHSGLHGHPR
jgi:hypothetical protein